MNEPVNADESFAYTHLSGNESGLGGSEMKSIFLDLLELEGASPLNVAELELGLVELGKVLLWGARGMRRRGTRTGVSGL